MAVPNRPAAGGVVESAWGGVVHDTVVAQDIQTGTVLCTVASGSGSAAITFPRPFASPPVVIANPSASAANDATCAVQGVTATGASVQMRAATNFGYTVSWLAIGPRA